MTKYDIYIASSAEQFNRFYMDMIGSIEIDNRVLGENLATLFRTWNLGSTLQGWFSISSRCSLNSSQAKSFATLLKTFFLCTMGAPL